MFQVHTNFDILIETVASFRRRNPEAIGRASQDLFDLLVRNVDEVLGDYPTGVAFDGTDPGDIHVHAAAIEGMADKLLTMNTKHFPQSDDLPYEVYHPDDFFILVGDSAPATVRAVTRKQNQYWQARRANGDTVKGLGQALADAGCPKFAAQVNAHLRALSGVRPRR